MLLRKRLRVEKLDYSIDTSAVPTIKSARLIHVTGDGALTVLAASVPDPAYQYRYLSQICLNGVPLVQINSPECPTCTSILANGYGIGRANCEALNRVRDAVNAPFVSLDQSIDDLSPILTLMESGLYMIADTICFPTDGGENFFWNTPDHPTENPATAGVLLPDYDYAYIFGQPVYLYPTQDADCYHEERVSHYVELFSQDVEPPRAVVYYFSEFIGFVLDGHHKACAAALLKRPVNSIVIIPYDGMTYRQAGGKMVSDSLCFAALSVPVEAVPRKYVSHHTPERRHASDFRISAGAINHRRWDSSYLQSAAYYPSVERYAETIAAGQRFKEVSNAEIEACLDPQNTENQQKLQAILTVLEMQRDTRLKETALLCARTFPRGSNLVKRCYQILAGIREDPEIEQFFIDYLIDHTDPHDAILPVIHSYWETDGHKKGG